MSDQSGGPGYWQASDGKWYPPESHPDAVAQANTTPPAPAPAPAPMSQPEPQQWAAPAPQQPPAQAPDPSFQMPPAPAAPGPTPQGFQTPPAPGPAGFAADQPGNAKKPFYRRTWVMVAAGFAAILVIVVAVSGGGGDSDGVTATEDSETADSPDQDSSGSQNDSTDDDEGSDSDGSGDDSDTASAKDRDLGDGGSSDSPWAFGSVSPIVFDTWGDADESAWNFTISPLRDGNIEVEAENQFNNPPPDGVTFAAFDVDLTLIEAAKEPLSVGFNFQWEIVGGATSAVYDVTTIETESFGCGLLPNRFDDYSEAFAGGRLTGSVCIPIPTEDLGHPQTRVALNFSGDRIYFGADGTTAEAFAPAAAFERADVSADRDGSRFAPWQTGVPTSVVFDSFGDADGSVWDVTLGAPRDITAEVLAENSFNDGPGEGVVFAGFDVEITLTSADKEPLSVGFNLTWEIIGGETALAYKSGTIATSSFGCGVTPNSFDDYAEVFSGGTVTGTVCIPIPAADLNHPNTEISLKFSDSRVNFGS